jgi:ribosomal protein S18 acetylase RimI-like enzyme
MDETNENHKGFTAKQEIIIREITEDDIDEIIILRSKTDQNNYTLDQLHEMGITKEALAIKIQTDYKGWLCELNKRIIGFAMGQKTTGEMWVIAVLPNNINKGIGSILLSKVEEWLFQNGNKSIWLTTDIDTSLRAYSFYKKNGWIDDRIENGLRYMLKNTDR